MNIQIWRNTQQTINNNQCEICLRDAQSHQKSHPADKQTKRKFFFIVFKSYRAIIIMGKWFWAQFYHRRYKRHRHRSAIAHSLSLMVPNFTCETECVYRRGKSYVYDLKCHTQQKYISILIAANRCALCKSVRNSFNLHNRNCLALDCLGVVVVVFFLLALNTFENYCCLFRILS